MIDWTLMKSPETRATEALAEAKAQARAEISAARATMITTLPGQQMIYMAKEAEAARYIADPAPDLATYPLLAAEIGITAPDAWQLAQIWLAMADLWRQAAAGLEALRLGTAAAVAAAGTVAEVAAALIAFRAAFA
ncbi:hypothetical protein SAMN04488103_107184 [Gemmobacter aquatilis]|uniref:Uncharacterized protein n=1 Tax=Gemmobacter aquatilis TaxID=933059 RepID=A0A1H8J962_9RHOB|nr:hypothetical protein [Gemmobacter aquatilis]SEN77239.1 hypothetical protein SAMN04488103_107184 [Gemmobacter aquatilis]